MKGVVGKTSKRHTPRGRIARRHKSWTAVFTLVAYQNGFAVIRRGKAEEEFPVDSFLPENVARFVHNNLRDQLAVYGINTVSFYERYGKEKRR